MGSGPSTEAERPRARTITQDEIYNPFSQKRPQNISPCINIVLLGKTGHGKSSTANSMVGEQYFGESDRTESNTSSVDTFGPAHFGNYDFRIVDTPGMNDTREMEKATKSKETSKAIEYMKQALDICQGEIHLFLIVVPYGFRYTKEEAQAILDITKTGYAEKLLDRTALVFTHGDDFRYKYGKSSSKFSKWCHEQEGALKELLDKVDYRCILFENLKVDEETKISQKYQVLEMANDFRKMKGAFTKQDFLDSIALLKKLFDNLSYVLSLCNIL